jgi:hypothetical protein
LHKEAIKMTTDLEPLEAARKQLEHVAFADFPERAKSILEDNGLFHNEYERAYNLLCDANLPDDPEYWSSLTSDIFFVAVNLVRMAERNLEKYDEYVAFVVNTAEIVGNDK